MSINELQYERNRYYKLRSDLRSINQRLSNSISEINITIESMNNNYKINDSLTNTQKLVETKDKLTEMQSNITNLVLPSVNNKIDLLSADIEVLSSLESE